MAPTFDAYVLLFAWHLISIEHSPFLKGGGRVPGCYFTVIYFIVKTSYSKEWSSASKNTSESLLSESITVSEVR